MAHGMYKVISGGKTQIMPVEAVFALLVKNTNDDSEAVCNLQALIDNGSIECDKFSIYPVEGL